MPKCTVQGDIPSTCGATLTPTLHSGVEADVQLVQKLKSAPRAKFTLGVKAEIEEMFSICPKLLLNAELYAIGPKAEEKDTIKFGKSICNPCGQCCSIY